MSKLALALLTVSSFAGAAKWDKANNPHNFTFLTKKPMEYRLTELKTEASLSNSHYIWSENYWPSMLGGIAYRWNKEPNSEPFKYKKPTKAELAKMSVSELEQLSPAEKYDIYMSDDKYTLTNKVLGMNSPEELWWEGICDGWSMAAVNHAEPQRVDLMSKDKSVVVPFGSTDVKGLLSFYYAKVQGKDAPYARVGTRCSVLGKVPGEAFPEDTDRDMPNSRDALSENCRDTNAGAFHVVITNMIGIIDHGFIAEVDRFNDVWNQPVGAYTSEIFDEGQSPTMEQRRNGISKIVRVKLDMIYGEELNLLRDPGEEGGYVSMDPVTGTPAQTTSIRSYEYTLELNIKGEIVGGEWISESRPDFLWLKGKASDFGVGKKGFNLSGLNKIYKAVE
jgi:hypothetical protein